MAKDTERSTSSAKRAKKKSSAAQSSSPGAEREASASARTEEAAPIAQAVEAQPNVGARPTKRPITVVSMLAQVVVIGLAAALVFGFVTVAKEGELRRSCAPTCLLAPDFHANLSSKEDMVHAPKLAPNFTLKDMNGNNVALSDYRGRVVILNFWMKSCPPCLEEFPDLVELAQVLAPRKDVAVVSVSIDEGPEAVRDTLISVLKAPPPFPVLFDPEAKIVRETYGTSQFPETWLIDKEGRIRARFDGPRKWTAGAMIELVDQVRHGEFCPMEIKLGKRSGLAHKQNICASGG